MGGEDYFDWGVTYEELKRRVDYQLETVHRIEERAHKLLRVLIASIGVILSGSYVLVSSIDVDRVVRNLASSVTLEPLAQNIETTFGVTNTNVGTLIGGILVIIATITALQSFTKIVVEAPSYAFQLWGTKNLESSLSLDSAEELLDNQIDHKQAAIEGYKEIIAQNEDEVKQHSRIWEKCRDSLRYGLYHLIASIFVVLVTFNLRDPYVASLVVLASIVISAYYFASKVEYAKIEQYLFFNVPIDGSAIILSIIATLTLITEVMTTDSRAFYQLAIFLLFGIIIWHLLNESGEFVEAIIFRYMVASLSGFLIMTGTLFTFPNITQQSSLEWLGAGSIAVFFVSLLVLVTSIIIYALKRVYSTVPWNSILHRVRKVVD